ncbi:hypothetical protein BV921_06565 [Pectobacterium odoriferum]|nr:hypothetical protein BV925_16015 [Pectobacterium odoriferum]POE02888.1 hypothetical protein BV916_15175 [Pectobacterium odoriferum]POE11334.1 hypothetical protein BV921_06565 [Pectobacterium odoriferum]POE22371.1 hypothetical protein BV923_10220 [Pectobacterium odoriferum]
MNPSVIKGRSLFFIALVTAFSENVGLLLCTQADSRAMPISVILQVACALAAFKYSARRGPRPKGPLKAAFKSAPGRFVTRITYLSKLIGTPSLAAFLQLELFRL